MDADQDFEAFWKKFLADHPSRANRWAHVAALVAGAGGAVWAIRRGSVAPAILGAVAAGALAVGGHPVFQGDRPKNFGRPLFAARAFVRLCVRTVDGSADTELAQLRAEASTSN